MPIRLTQTAPKSGYICAEMFSSASEWIAGLHGNRHEAARTLAEPLLKHTHIMYTSGRDGWKGGATVALKRNSQTLQARSVSPDATASGGVAETALKTASTAPAVTEERTLEQSLGATIRLLRKQADLTIADLASASDISIGMLSKIEKGQISPSLSTLKALATALNVQITALFSAFEEKRDCSYVRAGQGVTIERRGTKVGHQYSLLGHALGGDVAVDPYLITLHDEAAPYVGFQHEGVEFIYMLTGEVAYRHADQSYHLRPGDAMLFDSAALHGPETLISKPMTYLSIIIHSRKQD